MKILHRMKWFVALALMQVLVFNRMHIAGYATPFLYIYFILKFNSRATRNELMLWAFALGLTVDVFGNTPGMNAAAATLLAFFRTPLMRLVTLRDVDEGFRPGIQTLGASSFVRYGLLTCALYCVVVWLIDTFSFAHVWTMLLKMVTSTASTLVCVMCTESLVSKKGG